MRNLEKYRDLIAQAEGAAAANPLLYKIHLALLAALGIGYVVLLAVLATVCTLFVVGLMLVSKSVLLIKLALVPMGIAFFLARALWFRVPPPQGRRVTASEVPALFAEIEQLRRQVHAKPVHEVLLTSDFNAAVVQVPRLGMLGWPKRYLVIGLPLLASLPPYQFRAVLAHEFGHLAQNHARFGNWIYRIREMWSQILDAVEPRRTLLTGLFTRFFDWYAPYFNAYSFVLARANEYAADRESSNITSPEDAGDALAAVYSKSEYIETRFWSEFYGRAESQAQPPSQPFSDYVSALRSVPTEHSTAALAAALARETGLNDTHPSLQDRLRALGVRPNLPLCFQLSAAHALLRDKRLQLMHEFNEVWRELIAGPWKERHEFLKQTAEKLARFEVARQERGLTEDEHWDYACAIETLKGGRAALPVLDALLDRAPGHAPAYYARGRILLEVNEEQGVADVERAMQLDEAAREPGSQLLYGHFYARNQLVRCTRYRDILSQVARERQLAAAERRELRHADMLEPHGLTEPQIAEWRAVLARQKRLKRAWLVRKRVQHLQSVPAYVLVMDFGLLTWVTRSMLRAVLDNLPAEASCLVLHKSPTGGAHRRIKKIPDAFVYRATAAS
jgi:Zn-dependent protease with chaperone function